MLIEPRPLDDPDVQTLIDEVQLEYVRRYGGPDDTALLPHEFTAPEGMFLLAIVDGEPAGIGGWRAQESSHPRLRDGDAEIKRMYVRTSARRRGVARRLLAALERTAADAGRRRMVLETGAEQPEAIAMYAAAGYVPMSERFGLYANSPTALYFCKDLPPIRLATDTDLTVLPEIEQVSVHPGHARHGIGKALIAHAEAWARDTGLDRSTLTTFRDVPWNAPYYTRLGFRPVPDDDLSPDSRTSTERHDSP